MIDGTMSIRVIRSQQAFARAAESPSRWLHPLELARWEAMRASPGKARWLAGRWWLKRHVLECWNLGASPSELRIESRDAGNLGIAPQLFVSGKRSPLALSLSHSDGFVAAAAGPAGDGECGIDVVDLPAANAAALRAWISEQDVSGGGVDDATRLPAAWAAKEAAFKTLRGEAFRPGQISLSPAADRPWQWSYRREGIDATGEVELRFHSQFVLAIARRKVLC